MKLALKANQKNKFFPNFKNYKSYKHQFWGRLKKMKLMRLASNAIRKSWKGSLLDWL